MFKFNRAKPITETKVQAQKEELQTVVNWPDEFSALISIKEQNPDDAPNKLVQYHPLLNKVKSFILICALKRIIEAKT